MKYQFRVSWSRSGSHAMNQIITLHPIDHKCPVMNIVLESEKAIRVGTVLELEIPTT